MFATNTKGSVWPLSVKFYVLTFCCKKSLAIDSIGIQISSKARFVSAARSMTCTLYVMTGMLSDQCSECTVNLDYQLCGTLQHIVLIIQVYAQQFDVIVTITY